MARIPVTDSLAIEESELDESFILSSGPGGQNVNKVASAVQLRFDAAHSPSLPDDVRARLIRLAGARATNEGVLVIVARSFRSQERNREEARTKLLDLLRHASVPPKKRKPTKPSRAVKERRLERKAARSRTKRERGKVHEDGR